MGRESRASNISRPVFWSSCEICRLTYPTEAEDRQGVERLEVCQRCCVADIARLMRSHPETVRMLPVVRALQGKSQVREEERSQI